MTKSIDERVVEMQFDNKQFEQGIGTSLKSIDRLKAGLNFDKAANSLAGLERAGHSFSLAGISDTLDGISAKFSAMGVVGFTVIQNLTNAVIGFGKNMVTALTIDPIKTGLTEYETKMNAITTILTNTASKGTTLEDVTKTLDELNLYADKTIYNFAEMTKNIGTFTAAGIDLERSATAIKGIANLGAGSGSTPIQVSTAMYQLSQALASGTVKLIDWNSVVNAGMGGELFRNALIKSAKQMGIFVDESKPFRETLEQGWLTSEVLIKTLEQFANDPLLVKAATQVKTFTQLISTMKESMQSGWAKSWEYIIGDKEQSAKFLTSINDGFNKIIGSSTDARNETLAFWNANNGRAALIKSLANAVEYLGSVLRPIGKAFREIFPRVTGEQLVSLSIKLLVLTEQFKMAASTSENLKRTFKGVFALLDIGKQIISSLVSAFISVVKFLFPVSTSFLNFTGSIGDFIVAIDKALKSANAFTNVIKKIGQAVSPLANGIRLVITSLINALASLAVVDMTGFEEFANKFDVVIKPFAILAKMAEVTAQVFSNLANVIGSVFERIREFIAGSFNMVNFNALYDAINSGLFAAILYSIKKFIDSLSNITNRAGGILGGVSTTLNGVGDSLKALQASLKADTLMKIAISLGILAAALFVIAQIDPKKLTTSLGSITALFLELFGSMAGFELLIGTKGFLAMIEITTGMIGLSIAVLILASALKKLGDLDWKQVGAGLAGIAGITAVLIGAAKLLAGSSAMLIRSSIAFVIFGAALNILAKAVKELGLLDTDKLIKGLVGIGALLGGLALFMNLTDLSGLGIIRAVGIVVLAGAITVLANAVKQLSDIDPSKLVTGLVGLASVMAGIVVFTKVIGNPAGLIGTSVALTILGTAILLISSAIVKMGTLSWDQMSRGLLAMAGALVAITVALTLMPKSIFLKSIALLDVAGALVVLSSALEKMARLTWEEIAKSLVTLSVSLGLIISMFMILKQSDLVDSTAFLIMTVGITMLAKSLKLLGSMSVTQLVMGLVALAGTFALIGGVTILLTPLIPAILGLSGALVVFGVAVVAIGGGILMLATGLTALAVGGASVSVALTALVTSIAGMIPFILKTLAQGIIDFAKVIATGADTIANTIVTVLLSIVQSFTKLIPGLLSLAGKLISSVLYLLEKYMPKIIETGMHCIIAFLKGVSAHIKDVVELGIEVIIRFIDGVSAKIPDLIQSAFNLMVSFINGLADAVEKNAPIVLKAVLKLMLAIPKAVLNAVGTIIQDFFGIGVDIVQGMINGISSMIVAVANAAGNIGTAVVNAAKKVLDINSPSKVTEYLLGRPIVDGVVKGIEESIPKAEAASKKMAKAVVTSGKDYFDKAVQWIEDQKYYGLLTLQKELESWVALQKMYKAGTEQRIKADKEAYRVQNEMRKADFDASVKWINDRKYYSELGLAAELAAWQRVQSRYLEGTKEREDADKEVYRVQKEIYNAGKDYSEKMAQLNKDTADQRKSLLDEYYAKEKEINDKLISDIGDLTKEYDSALKSRTNALYSAYNLFDRVDTGTVSGNQLLSNLKGQVKAFENWQSNLNSLSAKGVDEGLIKELTEMGPTAANQIAALNKLSSDKLDQYVNLWRTKNAEAKSEATTELESTRLDMLDKIQHLNEASAKEMKEYNINWMKAMVKLNSDSATQLAALKTEWSTKMGEISTVVASTNTGIVTSTQTMRTSIEQEVVTLTENIKTVMSGTDWVGLGVSIMDGIKKGISSKSTDLANETARVALLALTSAKNALGIKSPSKAFAEVGIYAVEGFVAGLSNISNVTSSSKEMANTAVNSLRSAISNLANSVSGDLTLAPTIRPVLDLTDVEAGKSRLDSMFYSQGGINLSNTNNKIASITSGKTSILTEVAAALADIAKDKVNQNGDTLSFDGLFDGATFNVRSDADIKQIAKETAQEIYNRTQRVSRGKGIKKL